MQQITELMQSVKRSDENLKRQIGLLKIAIDIHMHMNNISKRDMSLKMGKHESYVTVTLGRDNISPENILAIAEALCNR